MIQQAIHELHHRIVANGGVVDQIHLTLCEDGLWVAAEASFEDGTDTAHTPVYFERPAQFNLRQYRELFEEQLLSSAGVRFH